jgi:hypothetical protein
VFQRGAQPNTIEDWLRLVNRNCNDARALLKVRSSSTAWQCAGFAVECTLKAAVMSHHRWNAWPSRERRLDLYGHNLHLLMREAGIQELQLLRDPIAHKWQTVLLWGRGDTYNPGAMPLRVAKDMVEAACGPDGVIQWIDTRFRLSM